MNSYSDKKLFDFLKELELIPERTLELAYQDRETSGSFYHSLTNKGLIADDNLGKIIAEIYSLQLVRLSQVSIPETVLKLIPEVVAKKQQAIAFKKDDKGLHVGFSHPENVIFRDFIEKRTGLPVIAYYATPREIEKALLLYTKNIEETFEDIISKSISSASSSSSAEPPIIKIVEEIITHAQRNSTSDIHIEPLEKKSLVRFRIDGILHDVVSLPIDLHAKIVTRIKVLAKLRTDEHQSSQDGKLQMTVDGDHLDIRVSLVPITGGEKVVMRILSEKSRQFSLESLGLNQENTSKIENAYKKPHGMILSTGPTGSGKTTTLYAILKLLNQRAVNIMTIEDPVEYDLAGVNQIQVNNKTNLTFAAGLRSIVRQDPDVILVGEIRDEETANIAVNSAMTGHLVLSSLHTNDAATTLPRLIDMEIEPFLVASTVNVIVAQRLVRKIHENCRVSSEENITQLSDHFEPSIIEKLSKGKETIRVYKGKGCDVCHGTGYEGRIGIFEIMTVTDELRDAIIAKKDASELKEIAVKNGMVTMLEDGIEKVLHGVTTIEEVLRVTKE